MEPDDTRKESWSVVSWGEGELALQSSFLVEDGGGRSAGTRVVSTAGALSLPEGCCVLPSVDGSRPSFPSSPPLLSSTSTPILAANFFAPSTVSSLRRPYRTSRLKSASDRFLLTGSPVCAAALATASSCSFFSRSSFSRSALAACGWKMDFLTLPTRFEALPYFSRLQEKGERLVRRDEDSEVQQAGEKTHPNIIYEASRDVRSCQEQYLRLQMAKGKLTSSAFVTLTLLKSAPCCSIDVMNSLKCSIVVR